MEVVVQQGHPIELYVALEIILYVALRLVSTWNVAGMTEELNF